MISAVQLVNGIWMGILLIALGLLPALLVHFSDSVRKSRVFWPIAIQSRLRVKIQRVQVERQPWLAALGAAIIAASVLLYATK